MFAESLELVLTLTCQFPCSRYILFIIVALSLVLICAATIVRQRASARILRHLLAESTEEWAYHVVNGTYYHTSACTIDTLLGQFLAHSGHFA
jgi:hypothetical protein